jgi:hypothetical protein
MHKIYRLTVVLLILVGWGATAQPTVSNISLTPKLDITHFYNYTLSADVTPGEGNTVTGVSFVVRPQTASANNLNWDFLTNGTAIPNPNQPLKNPATQPTTGNVWSFNGLRPDNIYSEIAFIYDIVSAPSNSRFWQNSYQLMRFTNNYEVTAKTSFFIEVNATPTANAPFSADMQVYLVGKGFNIAAFQTGGGLANEAWQTHASVELVGTINRNASFHHTHTENSSHYLVPLSTDADGKIGNKKLDINGDFWIILTTGHQLESRGWDMKYHAGCNNNSTWYKGSGTTFAPQSGCPDVHVHFAREEATLAHNTMEVKVEVNYTSNSVSYTYLSSPETFSFTELPNLAPNASAFTAPAPGTYQNNVTISWLPATDPNNDPVTYKLSLIDTTTKVKTIVATGLTGTSHVLNTTSFPNAYYDILVEACDTAFCTGFNWSSNIDEGGYFRILNKIWIGDISTSWSDPQNWSPNTLPTGSDGIVIPVTTNKPVISSPSAITGNLNIAEGATLTVTESGTLTVSGDLSSVNNGLIIESGAGGTGSLIHSSSIAGATIQRYFAANRWYIVGVPVINQAYSGTYFSDNKIPVNNPSSPSFYGITEYNETLNAWKGYFSSAATGTFVNGNGYLVRRSEGGNVAFSGIMASGNQDITLTLPRTTITDGSYGWNALGNPYPSAINTTSFINTNLSSLDPSFAALYIWDESAGASYKIVNLAGLTGYEYLQSGQGFFVRAKVNDSQVRFTPSMRVHQPSVTLKSGQTTWPGVVLAAEKGGVVSSTSITFREGMTNGLDVGYDAGVFKSQAPLSVYTHLVSCNGVDFGLQYLPLTALDRSTVEVGLEVGQTGEVRFTLKKESLESGSKVTLEDRKSGILKTFSASEDHHVAQVEKGEPAYGRFFLHFGSVTSADDQISAEYSAWYQQGEVKISGMMHGGTTLMLHDMQGRLLVQRKPEAAVPQNRLETGVLPNGIYLLTIVSGNQRTTLKIPVGNRH